VIALARLLLLACVAPSVLLQERVRAELDLAALDLAFLDHERLMVLSDDALTLYRLAGARLERQARLALPGEPLAARAPAGLLRVVPGENACWAATNRRSGATLLTVDDGRLAAVGGAEAIPPTALPGPAPVEGARFQAGTSVLRVGALQLLRLTEGLAVASNGELLIAGEPEATGRRAGDALAAVGPGLWLASGAEPPSDLDELLVLRGDGARVLVAAAFPVEGRIRALAARRGAAGALVAVATETPRGPRLVVFDLTGIS